MPSSSSEEDKRVHDGCTTVAELRDALRVMLPGTSVTFAVDQLLRVLGNGNGAKPTQGDRLLTVAQVAERLSISRKAVYGRAGGWPFTRRIGTALRFSERGLERWMATK